MLNAEKASTDSVLGNKELTDLVSALGCGDFLLGGKVFDWMALGYPVDPVKGKLPKGSF